MTKYDLGFQLKTARSKPLLKRWMNVCAVVIAWSPARVACHASATGYSAWRYGARACRCCFFCPARETRSESLESRLRAYHPGWPVWTLLFLVTLTYEVISASSPWPVIPARPLKDCSLLGRQCGPSLSIFEGATARDVLSTLLLGGPLCGYPMQQLTKPSITTYSLIVKYGHGSSGDLKHPSIAVDSITLPPLPPVCCI